MTVLALDLGATNLRGALVDRDAILRRETIPTKSVTLHDGLERLVTGLLRVPIAGVGVGVPEYVNQGTVTSAEVLDWTPDTAARVERLVARLTGGPVPVFVEADVRCAASAEHSRLDRPDRMSLLYVSWGSGVSSTLVLPGGACWAGARGEALALGEWRDERDRRLEDVASGHGIERAYAGGGDIDAIEIHRRALDGDTFARDLFETAGLTLATAIRHLVDVLDPHAVVLGGGLGVTEHLGQTALHTRLASGWRRRVAPPVLPARTGADAGLFGAAMLVRPRSSAGATP
ncbi:ROK family protein [Asanoa iriomotensis]|uniref:Glucokinase n=1 Tax=Asanoa iriomotensis TaxID=234613 RepID=A0ABQ4BZ09_9ACTN|nr:ROK family protein [Asanoa iriomotensis]GIF55772.1 glucokinase [Asanoa iriomotensis]